MTLVREARPGDVTAVRDLFVAVYGDSYGHPEFYDTDWLTRFVYDDEAIFLVAEDGGRIVASASALLSVGDADDLVALLGRLAVHPGLQARGIGRELVVSRLEKIRERVHFAQCELRCVHLGSQKLYDSIGFTPVGFQPMKWQFAHRESDVIYASLLGEAASLRRGSPRVLPEIAVLAQTVLGWMGLPVDAVVSDDDDGWPVDRPLSFERLEAKTLPLLLRIPRGRVTHREVFGSLSLSRGFFRLASEGASYVVARDKDVIVGGVGFTYNARDKQLRAFELVGLDDTTKGALLAEVDRIARELGAAYVEVDVSAHAPSIQRTLMRLGFVAVAYLPAMVFDQVERIDVIRMARLCVPYDPGPLELLPRARRLSEIVEQALDEQRCAQIADDGTRRAAIFEGLEDGERANVARLARQSWHEPGTKIVRAGEPADRVFVLLEGAVDATIHGRVANRIVAGDIVGEMALVDDTVRSADLLVVERTRLLEFPIGRLQRLMSQRPRIGMAVVRNLARSISQKLRARD